TCGRCSATMTTAPTSRATWLAVWPRPPEAYRIGWVGAWRLAKQVSRLPPPNPPCGFHHNGLSRVRLPHSGLLLGWSSPSRWPLPRLRFRRVSRPSRRRATLIQRTPNSYRPSPCGWLSQPPTVGSEEARLVARTLASVRRSNGACSFPALRFHQGTLQAEANRRNQCDQAYKAQLPIQMAFRQPFPPPTAPPLESLRPQTVQDPPIELSEELTDMSLVIVQAPAANDRIDLGHQCRSGYRSRAPGMLSDLLLEMLDRLLPGIG